MLVDPPNETLQFHGKTFDLVAEGRWSVIYKFKEHSLVLSKLRYDTFDWSYFEASSPNKLSVREQYAAAIAIYRVNDSRIPKIWSDHAEQLCGPNCKAPPTWEEMNEEE
ncbi:MAG: hypothetical protein AB8D78_12305 [Akkermansiaceae bacterium]